MQSILRTRRRSGGMSREISYVTMFFLGAKRRRGNLAYPLSCGVYVISTREA